VNEIVQVSAVAVGQFQIKQFHSRIHGQKQNTPSGGEQRINNGQESIFFGFDKQYGGNVGRPQGYQPNGEALKQIALYHFFGFIFQFYS
jgi:hypothetical protein